VSTSEITRVALTVDCVVFASENRELKALLVQRTHPPFPQAWALPGGFLHDESLDDAAGRYLREQVGLRDVFMEQLYTFGELDRDPRERVVSVAYYALVRVPDRRRRAQTDVAGARWFGIDELPHLAFDHELIVDRAHARLRARLRHAPLAFELLPPRFSLTQLQLLYETVLGTSLDKRNFRKKLAALDFIVETGELEANVQRRRARLFRFDRRRYDRLARQGVEMWL
jgi:8-oxo-dGTP diphosphatase